MRNLSFASNRVAERNLEKIGGYVDSLVAEKTAQGLSGSFKLLGCSRKLQTR